MMDPTKTNEPAAPATPALRARLNWARYEYVRDRGHTKHIEEARKLEGFYMGAGEQWTEEDRAKVEQGGRLAEEVNMIMPAVDTALGYQIANRVDISFRPRGRGADENTAAVLSKVVKQICDHNKYQWVESQVFADGLIERRGFFDIRMDFDDNMVGTVKITDLDQRDVMPDPDAKSYDPDTWGDVTVTRWLSLDEIEVLYGKSARRSVELDGDVPEEGDFGASTDSDGRNRFGDDRSQAFDAYRAGAEDGVINPRYRVIDRQYWKIERRTVAVYPTGDVRPVDKQAKPEQLAAMQSQGAILVPRQVKVVYWLVTTFTSVLFDGPSPYRHFTIVPYFPRFRRGKTRGMVDNAVSPQRMLNKATSSYVHAIANTANSGWTVQENSLANMDEEELEDRGSENGLVLVYKKGKDKPEKITPNEIPAGIDRVISIAAGNIKATTGINDALTADDSDQMSGVAVQARQFAAQQHLAVPLDNLARTRHMVAGRILELVQCYYDAPRVLRITDTDPMGNPVSTELPINQPQPDGSFLNDLTVGEYDVVVAETPMAVTFDNSQFNQAMEMRKEGIQIPDPIVLRYSSLADKTEIAKTMAAQQQPTDPTLEAKAALLKAQADKVAADTTLTKVETMFSATEAAQNIAAIPQVAPLADEILGSAGFADMNGPPLLPEAQALAAGPVPQPDAGMQQNTHPLFPPRTDSPLQGIDGGQQNGEQGQPGVHLGQ